MNVYGYTIKSSRFSNTSNYVVFAATENEALDKMNKEVDILLAFEDGWTWGTPTITKVEHNKVTEWKNANLIW